MYKDPKSQLSFQQMKQRQIAQQYLNIQENTQLLTQLVRFNYKKIKKEIDFNSIIDIKSIICLIVQQTYLVYTAFIKKTNIFISRQIYSKSTAILPEAYSQYLLQIDWTRYLTKQQEYVSRNFILIDVSKPHRKLVQYLCKFITNIKRKLHITFQKIKNGIEGFLIIRQFQNLGQMIQNIIMPQIHNISPKVLILCLQESQLFREYSLLVKCLNNSIFTKIYFNSKRREILQQLVELQTNLFEKSAKDHHVAQKRTETSIQQTITLLLRNNIIGFQQSLTKIEKKEEVQKQSTKDNQKDNKKDQRNIQSKPFLLGNIVYLEKSQKWKYTVKFNITQKVFKIFNPNKLQAIIRKTSKPYSSEEFQQNQLENNQQQKHQQQYPLHIQQYLAQNKQKKQEYLIEFASDKNLLTIKYITNVQMTIEWTDILMFQCNYFTHIWNNISLQWIQKQNKRYLAFKIISYLHHNERFIFKMLTMIDLLLVYSKATAEYFLKRSISDQHYEKANEMNQQCQQMTRIFISKIEKNYSALQKSLLKL